MGDDDEYDENEEDEGNPYRPPGNSSDGERKTLLQMSQRTSLCSIGSADKPY